VIAFLADENLKRKIIRGLLRRNPSVDVVRAQALACPESMIELCSMWPPGKTVLC
jgi:hypothetical protein